MPLLENSSRCFCALVALAALTVPGSLSRAADATADAPAPAKSSRCFSSDQIGQMFTRLERHERKVAAGFVSKYETDDIVVLLEPYIVYSDRDSVSDRVRQYLERPRFDSVEFVRGARKTLGDASMFKLPVSIGLATERSPGVPRDAPGVGPLPLGLILATPTISRDLAGWIEKNFVK